MDEGPTLTLEPRASTPAAARRFVRRTLTATAVSKDVVEAVVLLTSEIVTNAVLHARSSIEVAIRVLADRVRVEVVDATPDRPVRQVVPPDAASGHGLTIVDSLAADWGVDDIATRGKRVWFEVQR